MAQLRSNASPEELDAESRELASAEVKPAPELKRVSSKIATFIRGQDLAGVVGEGTTLEAIGTAMA